MHYFHPHTHALLSAFAAGDAHAAIIIGKEGSGLHTAAQQLYSESQSVYTVSPEKDEKIDYNKGAITIQCIRRLYDVTKTREPKGRIVVIEYAERMGIPAQNAFLKLLEEPVPGTRFILLAHTTATLLPTILSRTQHIMITPITMQQSEQLLDELKVTDVTKRTQLLFIAAGYPALLTKLVADETAFTARTQMIKDARTFITGSPYQRLVLANTYKNDRIKALTMIEDASKLLRRSLIDKVDQGSLKALEKLERLHTRLSEQGNVRLQLSAAVLL